MLLFWYYGPVASSLFPSNNVGFRFRGLKWNPLEERVERIDYDFDRLIIGTILFTVINWLLPTVVIFYVTCAPLWFGVLGTS